MASDDVWQSEPEKRSGCLAYFAGGLGLALAIAAVLFATVCCGCSFGWSAFVRFGIRSDLEEYRIDIRNSDLPEAEKESYVQRFEAIEDRLDAGELDMSFWKWVDASSDVEDVLLDGSVESWERPILEENVRKMER